MSPHPNTPARRPPPTLASVDAAADRARPPAQTQAQVQSSNTLLDFDRVYIEHFAHVSRWARALGGLDADVDDLAQDVFLVVRRKLSTFEGPSVSAWLYGITRKTVSDYRRRAWFRRLWGGTNRSLDSGSMHDSASMRDHAQTTQPFERWEAQQIVQRVLGRMSHVRRTAFMLFEIEGYSGEEVAELEQIPVATAYTRLHHARQDFLRFTAEITGEAEPAEEEPPP